MVNRMSATRCPWRSYGVVVSAVALAAVSLVGPTPPAHAADPITADDQPYFSYYHLDQARAKGYTGAGVTIAMIDGPVETTALELAGASIQNKGTCSIDSSLASKSHGTSVASILVSRNYGVAPDATLLTYLTGSKQDGDQPSSDCVDNTKHIKYGYAWLLNSAMNDGAEIINLSSSSTSQENELKWAIARSMAQGIIITASAGNEATDGNATSLSQWSGVVGVSAIGIDDSRQEYSSWGQGVTTAAVGGPLAVHDYVSGQVTQVSGTRSPPQLLPEPSRSPPEVAECDLQSAPPTPREDGPQPRPRMEPIHRIRCYRSRGHGQYGSHDPPTRTRSPTRGMDRVRQPRSPTVPGRGGEPPEIVNDNSYTYRGLDESMMTDPMVTSVTHLGTSPRYHAK